MTATINQQNSQMYLSNKFSTIKTIKDDLKGDNLVKIMDKALKHLNKISEANTIIQDLYIELVKEKKIMKYDQIRKIYKILTEGKAKEILFEREKQEIKVTDYESHEGLIRICWRYFEKLVQKITYYMVNESNLAIISKNVLKLIKLHQNFMRRFKQVKNSSMLYIIEIIQHLLIQNSILQKKIYDILLNRGYVVSLDQFYTLNGIGADHTDNYYAKQDATLQQDQKQQSQEENLNQSSSKNQKSIKNNIRKKKGFRLDCRYSWKNQDYKENDANQDFPSLNKTNYQIRESFQKLIGDIFQNDNFTQVLKKINFEASQDEEEETQNQTDEKDDIDYDFSNKNKNTTPSAIDQQKMLHKKIFQNKIQSVLNRLKSNSKRIKPSAQLLNIIQNAVNKAVSNKLNLKKTVQRKNSVRKESGNGLSSNVQKKHKQSSFITDRKIVNQNFFRELLRQNNNYQNFVQKQILKSSDALYKFPDRVSITQKNFNYNILDKNSNSTKNKLKNKAQKIRREQCEYKNQIIKNVESCDLAPFQALQQLKKQTVKTIKIKNFQNLQLNIKNFKSSPKNSQNIDGVSQIIRLTKQENQLNQQKKILKALQYLSLTQNGQNKLKLKSTLKNFTYNSYKDNNYNHNHETKKKSNFCTTNIFDNDSDKSNCQKRFLTQPDQKMYTGQDLIQYQEDNRIKKFRTRMNFVDQSQSIKINMKNRRQNQNTQCNISSSTEFRFRIYDRRRMKFIK